MRPVDTDEIQDRALHVLHPHEVSAVGVPHLRDPENRVHFWAALAFFVMNGMLRNPPAGATVDILIATVRGIVCPAAGLMVAGTSSHSPGWIWMPAFVTVSMTCCK